MCFGTVAFAKDTFQRESCIRRKAILSGHMIILCVSFSGQNTFYFVTIAFYFLLDFN